MKSLLIVLCFAFSSGAFAISTSKLIKKCEDTGAMRLYEMAQTKDCRIIEGGFKVVDVDNRFYNPSKYVWYSTIVTCDGQTGETIQTMVQYDSFSKKCL